MNTKYRIVYRPKFEYTPYQVDVLYESEFTGKACWTYASGFSNQARALDYIQNAAKQERVLAEFDAEGMQVSAEEIAINE